MIFKIFCQQEYHKFTQAVFKARFFESPLENDGELFHIRKNNCSKPDSGRVSNAQRVFILLYYAAIFLLESSDAKLLRSNYGILEHILLDGHVDGHVQTYFQTNSFPIVRPVEEMFPHVHLLGILNHSLQKYSN